MQGTDQADLDLQGFDCTSDEERKVGISERLCPRVDSLLDMDVEYLSARRTKLTLDSLVDNHHLPDKIHGKFVAELLGLVYLVIELERPHSQQRYSDVKVGCSRMEERVSDREARSLRTAGYFLLMLRAQHSPPVVAFVPLGILVRMDHYQSCPRVSDQDW